MGRRKAVANETSAMFEHGFQPLTLKVIDFAFAQCEATPELRVRQGREQVVKIAHDGCYETRCMVQAVCNASSWLVSWAQFALWTNCCIRAGPKIERPRLKTS